MTNLDDVRIERTPSQAPEPPPQRDWRPALVVIPIVAIIAIGYYLARRPAGTKEDPRATATSAGKPAAPTRSAEPGENIPLPPLDDTDALVRDLVARLSAHPQVAAWLATDQLIRNFTLVVVNIADGRSPAPYLQRLAPRVPFRVVERGAAVHVDPRSYERYDALASAVAAIDARGAARLYATLKPRIDDAYKELGAPHGDFDRTLERAIARLLQTRAVEGSIAVEPATAAFRFADPALESLSPAQKQLLRMGPANARTVRDKLREVAGYLALDPDAAGR